MRIRDARPPSASAAPVALAFAREGPPCLGTRYDEAKLADLKRAGIAEVAKLDAPRQRQRYAAMAKRAGKTDIPASCGRLRASWTVLDCSDEDWDFPSTSRKSMHRTIPPFCRACWSGPRLDRQHFSSAAGVFKAAPNRYVSVRRRPAFAARNPRGRRLLSLPRAVRCKFICPGPIDNALMLSTGRGGPAPADVSFHRAATDGTVGTAARSLRSPSTLATDESAFTTVVALSLTSWRFQRTPQPEEPRLRGRLERLGPGPHPWLRDGGKRASLTMRNSE